MQINDRVRPPLEELDEGKKKKKKGKKRKEKKENFVPRSGELRGWCIDIRILKV